MPGQGGALTRQGAPRHTPGRAGLPRARCTRVGAPDRVPQEAGWGVSVMGGVGQVHGHLPCTNPGISTSPGCPRVPQTLTSRDYGSRRASGPCVPQLPRRHQGPLGPASWRVLGRRRAFLPHLPGTSPCGLLRGAGEIEGQALVSGTEVQGSDPSSNLSSPDQSHGGRCGSSSGTHREGVMAQPSPGCASRDRVQGGNRVSRPGQVPSPTRMSHLPLWASVPSSVKGVL